jgi:hypothetical protein
MVAIMKHKLIVVDDFYENPMSVREFALNLEYRDGGTYPGKDTAGLGFDEEHVRRLANIINRPIERFWPTSNFRLSLEQDTATRHIHFDVNTHIANICLTLDEDCKGGVALWRHKKTGLETVDERETELINKTGMTFLEVESEIVRKDGQDESNFELITYVPYKFNRCVIIYGRQLHSPLPQGWGDSPENGRLTRHFFFNIV